MKTWEAASAQRPVKLAPFLISSGVFGLFLLSLGWFSHFQLSIQIGLGGSQKGTAEPRRLFTWCWYSMSHSVVGTYYKVISPLKQNKMKLLPSQVKNQVHRSKCSINTDIYGSILYNYSIPHSQFTLYPQPPTLCTSVTISEGLENEKIIVYCMVLSIWLWQ